MAAVACDEIIIEVIIVSVYVFASCNSTRSAAVPSWLMDRVRRQAYLSFAFSWWPKRSSACSRADSERKAAHEERRLAPDRNAPYGADRESTGIRSGTG